MIFYIFFFLLVLFFSFSSSFGIHKISDGVKFSEIYYVGIFYVIFSFFLISSIRYNVGTDYIAYYNYSKEKIIGVPFFEALKQSEVFFVIFSKISFSLCGNNQILYAIISFFISFFTVKGILYYEKNIFLPILFFFITTSFFISLNAMRQMVSFSIFLYASRYIIKKDFFKYLKWIIIAFCWHTSAVFYISCYFIANFNIKKMYIPIVILMFFIKKIINSVLATILEKLGLELAYYFILQEGASSKTFIFITIIIGFIFSLCKNDNDLRKQNLFFNSWTILIFISIIGDGIPGSFRLVYLFWPMAIVICPYILSQKKNFKTLNLGIFILLYSFFFWKNQIVTNAHDIVPYKSIINIL